MRIAIIKSSIGIQDFTHRWIDFCRLRSIDFEVYEIRNRLNLAELSGFDIVLWHVSHANYFDKRYGYDILRSLELSDIDVFPSSKDLWLFDNKLSQFIALRLLDISTPASEIIFELGEALDFANKAKYPFVFKLKGGASSSNVRLVRNKAMAYYLALRCFSFGFRPFNRLGIFLVSLKSITTGRFNLKKLLVDLIKIIVPSKYERLAGREKGYFYVQEFIANNTSDIRVIVINSRAFAIRRYVRPGDFRASGSGLIDYSSESIDLRCVELAFEVSRRAGFTCMGYDFVFGANGEPVIIEMSYGFAPLPYRDCPGFWDESLIWHPGEFYPEDWMVEGLLDKL